MQWSKVSAVAALLLLLGGCAGEAEGQDQDAAIGDPNRALTLEEVDHESTSQAKEAAPVINPGQTEETDPSGSAKPQPDPWTGAATTASPEKPQPDPWNQGNSRSTTAQ